MEITETNHKIRIGKRIAELRKERGLSQAKLAQLTGIQSSYIGQIELGKYDVGISMLSKIGDALEMTLDFIPKEKNSVTKHGNINKIIYLYIYRYYFLFVSLHSDNRLSNNN